ncbi:MAG: argininosuccinate lyase [Candidatus Methylacidiphilales bacterium]
MQAFTRSVHFDRRLYRQDIAGSLAHAAMLQRIGIITSGEWAAIRRGLLAIRREIDEGRFVWKDELEDVHMNIEGALTAREAAGAKLHTGRSRNDQVATDTRLWVKEEIAADEEAIRQLQRTLIDFADRTQAIYIPGYTHLQRGQPVSMAHHLLAYVEMLERDLGRFSDAAKRADVLPLGSGALAGSTLPLDREFVRRELGFAELSHNSLDAVSDRDFMVEYGAAAALLAVHLSRLAEDLILWSSAEFGFVRIGDAFTTGSSLMPQKKNPDIAELVRGKTGRVTGNLVALLMLLKGLPLSYNRDLQEDKERLFDTADTIMGSLQLMAAMLTSTEPVPERCAAAVSDPLLLATDVADGLVRQGIPFRHAHEIVGQAVARAEAAGIPLNQLSLESWQEIDRRVRPEAIDCFDLRRALAARKMVGAPSPLQVRAEIRRWRKRLGSGKSKSVSRRI